MNKKQFYGSGATFLISLEDPRAVFSANGNVFKLTGFKANSFVSGEVSLANLFHSDDKDISDLLFSGEHKSTFKYINFRIRSSNGLIKCVKASYRKIIKPKANRHALELVLEDSKNIWKNKSPKNFTFEFISMMENTNDYIYFKDRNHVFTGASQTLVNLTNPSKHWTDLLGKTDYDVFPEEYADIYYDLEKQVFSGIAVAHEIQETMDNHGIKGWVDNRKYPILNKKKEIIGLFGVARDITDTKNTQEKLSRSRKKLVAANKKNEQILNSTGEGIYGLDNNGITTFANPAAIKMLGYTLNEMKNKYQHNLIHHSKADGTPSPRQACKIYNTFKTGLVERVSDEVFWRKDGSCFPVDYISTPIIDNGKVMGAVVSFLDISSRIIREDSLLQTESRFRTIFEESPLGVALIESLTGKIIEVNNQFSEIAGIPKNELKGKSWMDLFHPDDIDEDWNNYAGLISGKYTRHKTEKRFIRKDGTGGWIRKTVTKVSVDEKRNPIHLAMIEDITNKKLIEEQLLISEKRFRTIFEESPLGVALIDSISGHIYEVNPRFADIAGRTLEEMQTINWMSITHPDDVQKDLDNMAALNAGKISGFNMEKRYIKPDNSHVWINLTVAPIKVEDKSKSIHLAMIEDITEKRKNEEDLKKYQNHLEDEINKRTLELKESQKRLIHSEKLSTLGKFAGTVAHEFNNPLFGVINLIEQIDGDLSEHKIKTFSKLAVKECWRMADMIKNLQSFYKPSEDNFTINQMDELVEEVLLITSKACKNKGIKIYKNFNANKYSFEGIEDQIKQVILNLMKNCIDSISKNGGKITLSIAQVSKGLMLEIQDTGKGIEVNDMKFIFDPFFTTKGKDGTGLGLSVSYGIIKNHGGSIAIESELGIGSTATLVMPISRKS